MKACNAPVKGAFTTFSTFALESANFIQGNALPKALLYIALQNLAGVGAVFAGFGVVRLLPH
ncbi:MAG: CrcB family protein [Victivallales bacterium]|jgi:fluoride ion exporter CrcB/FEX|nr:CrcB family protein [Victivallales bacterium]